MRRHGVFSLLDLGRALYVGLALLALTFAIALSFAASHDQEAKQTAAAGAAASAQPRWTGRGEDVGLQPPAQTLHLALQWFIEAEFGQGRYVGPCENAISPRDLWKRCTRLIADQGTRLAFLEGPTFSEFVRWIFVEQTADSNWRVIGTAPFDFFGDTRTVPWP
ncbi:MAG TPA: hypothetical protein VNL15_01195 [Dehalococcoidia bacterium]|nr:hypothetical protein [Dehalococcoidia bacterium]